MAIVAAMMDGPRANSSPHFLSTRRKSSQNTCQVSSSDTVDSRRPSVTREVRSLSKVPMSSSRSYTSQRTPETMLDSALHLASQAIGCLSESLEIEWERLLVLDICSISGTLSHLRQMLQDPMTRKEWTGITDILCVVPGPLQKFAADMEYLTLKYPSRFLLRTLDVLNKPSKDQKELAEVKSSVESLKAIFIFALRNDPTQLSQVLKNRNLDGVLSHQQVRLEGKQMREAVNQREQVTEWLSVTNVLHQHTHALSVAKEDTGEWFLSSSEFKAWICDSGSLLWLYGIPGSGKTVLCAMTIEHIKTRYCQDRDGLAYFYFCFRDAKATDVSSCLRSLILQLSGGEENLPVAVQNLYNHYVAKERSPDRFELLEVLILLCRRKQNTFLIIEALDEAFDKQEVLEILSMLAEKKLGNLHLLVFSRLEKCIEEVLAPIATAKVHMAGQTLDRSVSLYVQEYLEDHPKTRKWPRTLKSRVESLLVRNAEGRFHWVACCLAILRGFSTEEEIMKTLESLPKDLCAVYDGVLSNIAEEHVSMARNAFQWLAYSERPLRLNEFAEAAILGPLGSLNIEDRFTSAYDVVDICSNLVAVTPTGAIDETEKQPWIGFAHITVKEFLINDSARSTRAAKFAVSETKAQTLLCHACLSYLLISTRTDTTLVDTYTSLPLFSYAKEFWYKHMVILREKDRLSSSIVALAVELFDIKRSESLLRGNHSPVLGGPEGPDAVFSEMYNFPTPLYYACILGLSAVVSLLIERGDKLDQVGGYCGSSLHAAAFNGDVEVLYLLLNHGADVNFTAGYFGSVLQIASYCGHVKIIQLLLDHSADVNSRSGYYGGALQAAAAAGRKEGVELLLQYGADINAQGGPFGDALSASAEGAHVEVVRMLLENGADPNAQESLETRGALYQAAARGHSEVVRLLLGAGAKLDSARVDSLDTYDSQTESPLTAAARGGYVEVVQMLMRADCDDTFGKIPALHAASQNGHDSVVELLLRVGGFIVNSKDEKGCSPWLKAASRGHIKTLNALASMDARPSATDNHGATALMMATEGGHEEAVHYLIKLGANIGANNTAGQTAMDIAIARQDHAIVRLLTKDSTSDNSSDYSDNMDDPQQLQRSSSLRLDMEHDLTKRIPLSTLQRAFTWESDDEDVNDDTTKERGSR